MKTPLVSDPTLSFVIHIYPGPLQSAKKRIGALFVGDLHHNWALSNSGIDAPEIPLAT